MIIHSLLVSVNYYSKSGAARAAVRAGPGLGLVAPYRSAELVQSCEVIAGQAEAAGRHVLLQMGKGGGPWDAQGDRGMAEQPGERHLGPARAVPAGDLVERGELRRGGGHAGWGLREVQARAQHA